MRLGIVMMPGGNALWDPLTVEENLRLGAFVLRNDADERQRRLDRGARASSPSCATSSTSRPARCRRMKQMVALAKAMLLEPEVLLIDELSLGLSPIAAQDVLAKVEQLREEGLTIVIVEQSVNVALSIADRAVFMEKGQVRFDGPPTSCSSGATCCCGPCSWAATTLQTRPPAVTHETLWGS